MRLLWHQRQDAVLGVLQAGLLQQNVPAEGLEEAQAHLLSSSVTVPVRFRLSTDKLLLQS